MLCREWARNGKKGKLHYGLTQSTPPMVTDPILLVEYDSGAGIGWLGALNLPSSRESSSTSGPSAEYLGSLLNVNEDLLAQSLANTNAPSPAPHHQPTSIPGIPMPLATPSSESILTTTATTTTTDKDTTNNYVTSPPITPDESLLKCAIHEPSSS